MAMIFSELFGTMILIILGDGVVANVTLSKSKGNSSGWIVITTGWGFAVGIAVYVVGWVGGAHLNPAVTIGLASIGAFPWALVPAYIGAQMVGAFLGAIVVYLAYHDHFAATDDADGKLGVFCTGPAIRSNMWNLITEIVGTAMLLIGILGITNSHNNMGALGALAIGILIWAIGLSLGGPTGYAINPARDLGPRIAHAILPIPGKRDSDWSYSWIPIVGPIIGGVLGAWIYNIALMMFV
ncbi:MIP/aquaporin family protein [Acetobacterium woodii]|nr:MIP/aquaporin family protein [Acetobacterium woodii]